ncbi:MAG: NPCBM/NEW2 domain-containing protein [Planctomycetota bacterium]
MNPSSARFPSAFFPLALLLPAGPGRQSAVPAGAEGAPRLVLEALDGTARTLDPAGFRTTDPRGQGAWIVRPSGYPPPDAAAAPGSGPAVAIGLADGDLLRGRIAGGAAESLRLELFPGVELAVGVDRLRSLVIEETLPETLGAPLEAPPEGDRLYRRAGGGLDRDDGAVVGFSAAGVTFESDLLGTRLVPWGELAALFAEVLTPRSGESGADGALKVAVDLADGGRVRGRLVELAEDGVRLEIGGSGEVRLPLARVAQVAVDDGAFAFLSDLPALREEGMGTPFADELGMRWPHRIDREAVERGLLVAGGERHFRGIGTHAPTRVTWALDPAWRTLRGLVAVDDSVLRHEARGAVIFRIRVDGEVRWESAVRRGGDPPFAIPPLDLGAAAGVRELTLEADPAGELDFAGDRADWLRMILVRG